LNSLSLSLSLKLIVARLISKQNKREIKCVKEPLMKGLCLIRTIASDTLWEKKRKKKKKEDLILASCPQS